jgi:hypothetical protein
MGELLAKIIDIITGDNSKGLKRLLIVVAVLLPILLIFGNYFYGNIRIEQKVRILKELSSIKESEIENTQLKTYYDDLVSSLVKTDLPSAKNIQTSNVNKMDFTNSIVLWKFLSGSILGILLMIVALFAKYEKAILKIVGFILVGVFAAIIGGIGLLIPTFDPPMINYFGYPIVQLILLIIGVSAYQKSKV